MSNPHYLEVTPLNERDCLLKADINHQILIQSVMVTGTWEVHIPAPEGQECPKDTKEGVRVVAHVADDMLERPSQPKSGKEFDLSLPKDLEPFLSSIAVVRAICKWHQIGSVWIVQ
ncbi:hypothetical protein BDV19DRAFT_395690 [Aspergillus venezuelensis]